MQYKKFMSTCVRINRNINGIINENGNRIWEITGFKKVHLSATLDEAIIKLYPNYIIPPFFY